METNRLDANPPIKGVDINPLREFGIKRVGRDSILTRVLMKEPDILGFLEFVHRIPVWLSLVGETETRGGD